jgi:hypothetical protein
VDYLPGLALNCNPPDLCLLSSWDYSHEPPAPFQFFCFEVVLLWAGGVAQVVECLSSKSEALSSNHHTT